MPRFQHGSVHIAFLDEGPAAQAAGTPAASAPAPSVPAPRAPGEAIILVHGFASTKEVNWVQPGWIATLTRAGRRAIALDNRGHGESSKLHEPAAYHTDRMADDVRALMDHLGLDRADLMGYSMGARVAAFLAVKHGDRVRSLILGGLGFHLVDGVGLPDSIADALEAPSLADVTDPQGRSFRAFAEQTKSDLAALAACIRGSRQTLTRDQLAGVGVPALIAVGTKDQVAGSAHDLAALMPDAQALDIPGRDHMLAVGDKVFKAGVVDFLERRP